MFPTLAPPAGGALRVEAGMIGIASLVLAVAANGAGSGGPPGGALGPDTVVVRNGALNLRAVLWRPAAPGRHPGVLFNPGSGHASPAVAAAHDHRQPNLLGPVFARHGYVFLYLFRRGDGLSAGLGRPSADQ